MNSHTSGDWYVNCTTVDDRVVAWEIVGREYGSSKPLCVGMVKIQDSGKEIVKNLNDANLMSAAPNLLEALEEAIQCCGDHDPIWLEDAIYAVAKAKGELHKLK